MLPSGSVDSMKVSGWLPKLAVAVVSAPRLNVQLGFVLPAQGPLVQLTKRPVVAEANRVIDVPDAKLAVHVEPQSIPAGELVTLPVPPFWTLVTLTVNVPGGGGGAEALKLAVTVLFLSILTVQEPVPVQPPPLQPAKTDPEAGWTVRVTVVFLENDAEHVVPQLMPLGLLVTVPLPVPFLVTCSVKGPPPPPLPLAAKPPTLISAVGLGWVGGV
jgi:hypothetical protein